MRNTSADNNKGLSRDTIAHRFHLSAPVVQVLKDQKLATGFKHFISSLGYQIPELGGLSKKLSLVFGEVQNDGYQLGERGYINLTGKCFKDAQEIQLAYALFNTKKDDILNLGDNFIGTLQQYFGSEENPLYIKEFFLSIMFGLLQGIKIHSDEQPVDISDFRYVTADKAGDLIAKERIGEVIELFPVDGRWEI